MPRESDTNQQHKYTNKDYYEMMLCIGAADGNISEARRLYRERFIDGRPVEKQRRLPSYTCFRNLALRLPETGSFHPPNTEGRPVSRDPDLDSKVLKLLKKDPAISTRRAAAVLKVNHMAVWDALNKGRNEQKKPRKYKGGYSDTEESEISTEISIATPPAACACGQAGAATVEEIIIKEEISEEEKKQCRLCLSVDRSLEELGEFAPLYRKLLFENYQNTTIPSFMYEMLACWECRAELRRIQKFQDKVRRANAAFETSQNQNCEDLSTLSAVLIGEPVAKTAPEQSEPATSLEECAQTIKEEEVEPPEVEETTLPDPLAVNLGVVKSSNEEVINIEFEREPKRSVKERAKPAQTRAKRAADVKETPTKRAKLARSGHEKTAGQDADDDTPLSQMTSQPHDVTVRADAPIDCDEIFGKVKIEFAELQCILSERRNKQSFKSMQYKCDSCVLGFTDQSRLQEHNSNFHNKNVGSCECDICERRFVDPEQLAAHYGNHFVKFVCKLCQFECYTKTGRVIHFKRHRDAHSDSVLRQRLAQASSSSE